MSDDLQSIADKFKATLIKVTNNTSDQNIDDIDLTTAISERMGMPAPSEPEEVVSQTKTTPPKARSRTTPKARQDPKSTSEGRVVLPNPVLRAGPGRTRVTFHLPAQFDELRHQAKEAGLASALLIASAIHAHGNQVASYSETGGLQTLKPEGLTRWPVNLTPNEMDKLDELATQLEPALGKKSRSAVVSLLLAECHKDPLGR